MKKVLIVAVLLMALPVVAAPVATTTNAGGPVVAPVGRDTLWDQTDSPVGGITSQDFEAAYDQYDAQGADDFVVTGDWSIDYVAVNGSWSAAGPANGLNVFVYADAGGAPGAEMCSYLGLTVADPLNANLSADLPSTCDLTAGTYWFSAQGAVDFAVGGQWYWSDNTSANGYEWMWQNPGGGFGIGCLTWGDGDTCLSADYGPDLGFLLGGTGGGAGSQIPTVSTWGLVVLTLIGFAIATIMFGRRRATA